jgi:hypothetical protein
MMDQSPADREMGKALAMALDMAKGDATTMMFDDDAEGRPNFLGGTIDGTANSITAKRDGAMVTVTVTDTGGTPARTDDFEMQMDGPMMIGDGMTWNGSMHMRDPDADEDDHDMMAEYVAVYTDIKAPTPMAINDDNFNGSDDTIIDREVDISTAADSDDLALAASPSFPAAPAEGSTTKTFEDDAATDDDEREFAGTLQGGAGMFACTADCTVTVNSKGEITAFAGTWSFTWDKDVKIDVADMDYMYFGWWVNGPTGANDDNEYSYMFQTVSGGSVDFPVDSIVDLTGMAEYNGGAAGKYVVKDVSDGNIQRADMGKFTADVSLEADFDVDIIGGNVSNFMAGDEMMEGWYVRLNNVRLPTSGESAFAATTNATLSGMDNMKAAAGHWNGQFHGDGADDAKPSGVSGRFDAHFDAAHIAGAFGAELDD